MTRWHLNATPTGAQLEPFTAEEEEAADAAAASAAPPVPETISDRQFAQGLAHQGLITQAEALSWVRTGALPVAISSFLGGLPEAMRFDAEMLLSGATEFHRSHPLTAAVAAETGMTSAQVDDLWRFCATL